MIGMGIPRSIPLVTPKTRAWRRPREIGSGDEYPVSSSWLQPMSGVPFQSRLTMHRLSSPGKHL